MRTTSAAVTTELRIRTTAWSRRGLAAEAPGQRHCSTSSPLSSPCPLVGGACGCGGGGMFGCVCVWVRAAPGRRDVWKPWTLLLARPPSPNCPRGCGAGSMAADQPLRLPAPRRAEHRAISLAGRMAAAGARCWSPGYILPSANDSDSVGLGLARRQCLSCRCCRVGARNRPVAGAMNLNGRQPLQRPGASPPRPCHPRRIVTCLDRPGSTAAGSTRGDGLSVVRRCPALVLLGPSQRRPEERRMGGAPSPGRWRSGPPLSPSSPPSLVSADYDLRPSSSPSLLGAEDDHSPAQGSPLLRVL